MHCNRELDEAVAKAKEGAGVEQRPATPGERKKPKGRRDLLASNLPRCLVEILDEELEAKGCRRIGFEESAQLMFRRGGRNLATKALGYAFNQEAELLRVLENVNLPLDNTRSERELRKIVVGLVVDPGRKTHGKVPAGRAPVAAAVTGYGSRKPDSAPTAARP